MSFDVLLSEDAERGLEDIYRYIASNDTVANADDVLSRLEDACAALQEFPQRGNVPKELEPLGLAEFREVHRPPYRIIYRVLGRQVIVYCILDGRRDMRSLLERRLLR